MRHAPWVAALLVAAGCGGTIDAHDLRQRVETLGSLAAEGRLLGDDVAADRSLSTFVRVHARELAAAADHQAEQLADATAPTQLADVRSSALVLARRIARDLGDLQVTPDAMTGRRVAAALGRRSREARRLQARP